MQWIVLALGCCMCSAIAAPLKYHDQRQNGDYNIRGRLQNFVVFIVPTSSFSLFDFAPSRQQHYDTRSFYTNLGFQRDDFPNVAPRRAPVMEEKSFQVEEEMLVDEPTEISLDQGVQSYQDVEVPVDISPEQVKKAKVISTTLKKSDKEGVLSRFGGMKSAGSQSNTEQRLVAVAPKTQEGRAKSVTGLPSTSGQKDVVTDNTEEEKSKSVVGLPSNEELKGVMVMLSTSEKGVRVTSGIVPKDHAARRLDVDAVSTDSRARSVATALTDDRSATKEKVKLLSAGIDICSPNQRRDDEGNCQTIKHKHRSGQYFESGGHVAVNRVNPVLSFGLSPANE